MAFSINLEKSAILIPKTDIITVVDASDEYVVIEEPCRLMELLHILIEYGYIIRHLTEKQ